MNQKKEVQLDLAVQARLLCDTNYELGDSTRWRQVKFSVGGGEHWRGPRQPARIGSHIKRYVLKCKKKRIDAKCNIHNSIL